MIVTARSQTHSFHPSTSDRRSRARLPGTPSRTPAITVDEPTATTPKAAATTIHPRPGPDQRPFYP